MNFRISRDQFLGPLQLVSGAIERRHTLPILSNILLKVHEGTLWLTGTDLEVELVSNIANIENAVDGQITVPAKKLVDICRGLSDSADIEFSLEKNKALIKAGRGRYTLSTLKADDYPNLEDWSGDVEFVISQKELKHLIDSTSFAMAQQDVRYYLNGMSLETEAHLIRTVATDGHRLALCNIDYQTAELPARQVIIPRKGVLEISRLIEDNDNAVKVKIGSNHISIKSSHFVFTSKLVDGRFPDHRRVIPKETTKEIVADKVELKQAFTRAAILSNEKFRGVRLNLATGLMRITANNPEQEQAEESVDVTYEGEELEIGFNVAYLIDVLNNIDTDHVKFHLTDPNTSALIEAANQSDALYVIMPMRL